MENQNEFAEIEKTMTREEIAILKLIIHLHKKEAESSNSSKKTELSFDGGFTSQQILEAVKEGDKSLLPIPNDDEYSVFGWTVSENGKYKSGSPDIRIYDSMKNGVNTLKLFANSSGDFREMQDEFEDILNKVDYPIFAEDRKGFKFENDSFKNLPK